MNPNQPIENNNQAQPSVPNLTASAVPSQVDRATTEVKKRFYKCWWFWSLLVCAVIAIIGIVVGISSAILAIQAQAELDELKVQLDESRQLAVKYGSLLGIKVNEYGNPVSGSWEQELPGESEQQSEKFKSSKDYIYLGQWGIKIRIPQDLDNVSYVYQSDADNPSKVCFWATPSNISYVPSFAQYYMNPSGMGCLVRYQQDLPDDIDGTTVYTANDYKYQFYPASYTYTLADDSETLELEKTTIENLSNMLTKIINYSEF